MPIEPDLPAEDWLEVPAVTSELYQICASPYQKSGIPSIQKAPKVKMTSI